MDARVEDLSLRERAAQLVFPRIGSNMPPPVTVVEDLERVSRLLERCPVGGLVLFNGRLPETPEALASLQARSRVPLLVGADMERGVGQQVRGATVFPHAMAFGMAEVPTEGAEKLLEKAAYAQAHEALAAGLHITFSPVADVNRNPRNPIIATRAFGTEPARTARFVRAYVRGSRAAGLLTTAKHFPGHGDTSQDSHAELPHVSDDRETLARTDLVPFRAAIDAGVDLVMTAHVVYPALDPSGTPATLSRSILVDLLRDQLGFQGAVVSDSLLMGAVRDRFPTAGAQAVALLKAGVDILLDVPDPEASVEGIVAAVETGRLEAARVDEACGRILALKRRLAERFGSGFFTDPGAHVPMSEVGSDVHRSLAREAARNAVRVREEVPGTLPLDAGGTDGEGVLVVLVKPHQSRLDPPEEPLGGLVRAAYPKAVYRQVGPDATVEDYSALLEAAGRARRVVLALVVKPAAWHAFGLLPEQEQLARALVERHQPIVASLGSPVIFDALPGAPVYVCTYSDVAPSQQALAEVVFGARTA